MTPRNPYGSFDLSFTLPAGWGGASLTLTVDVHYTTTAKGLSLVLTPDLLTLSYGTTSQSFARESGLPEPDQVRVVGHGQFISVSYDGAWVHTFTLAYADWPEQASLTLAASTAVELADLRVVELDDWRDAVYIDLETSSRNAISSVIQQRPVEAYGRWDGRMDFYYSPVVRYSVTISYIRELEQDSHDQGAVSDGLVYGINVDVINDAATAEELGFITRLFRLPELDRGAVRAARVLAEQARQRLNPRTLLLRPNFTVEVGDLISYTFVKTGSGVVVEEQVIVEQISFSDILDGRKSMTITGRLYWRNDGSA